MKFDGSTPTLVDAYGGFEISMTPHYSAGVGIGWLERGGCKVIANVRGGGEYGPSWHQAALKEKRYKAYEDVEAVAADVIARGISSTEKLAVIGGSNGGLMVGNMITRPVASSLFGAAVCQVPLLDMKRYSHLLAGASWMAEYGDPDTDEWKFLRQHSPYQLLRHDRLGIAEDGEDRTADDKWTCPRSYSPHLLEMIGCTRATRARWSRLCWRTRHLPRYLVAYIGRTPRAATAAPPTTSSGPTRGR